MIGSAGSDLSMVTVPRFEDIAGRIVPKTYHDIVGVALVITTGLFSGLSHLLRPIEGTNDSVALLFGTVIPLLLSVLLVVGGTWLRHRGYDGLKLRVGMWCLVGVSILIGVSLVTVQHQAAYDVDLRNTGAVVGGTGTVGGVLGLLIGMYDAERVKSERRMAGEREKAERLSQRLTVLNRVLRHDIRNDVNVIYGNADRLTDGTDAGDPAQTIKKKAMRLNRLSESAREIESLLEHDGLPTESIDIAALLREEGQTMTRYGNVELETSIPDNARAVASPKIEIAIGHLIENAVEHNDSESPWVRIEANARDGRVELRILDNGPGLPDEEIRVLQRGHETAFDHASGLGLWLANWIVTESGGEIGFEREESGSAVVVRLPRANKSG